MEYEGIEQEILLEPENAIVSAVYSVNGKTGDVVLTTSDLENDSDYQTGDEVDAAIATAIAGKQDTLTAGNNIQISAENVISATDTTYSAGNGLNLSSENAFSVDTTVVATQQNLATEVQNRENADNALQAQIDGISASSDVVDIVGTYADLQNYDTQHLKDNDIIKVLQDETQNDATTYYRWSTTTETFTLIGQEGPYYTKAAADAQFVPQTRTVNGKALSSNITLNASDVSALGTSDVVQTTGSSTSQVMSQNATTQALGTKLNITDYVVDDELKNSTNPVQNGVLYGLLGNMPTDFFTGNATSTQTGTEAQFTNALKISDIELQGDTFQQTYSGANLFNYTDTSLLNPAVTLGDDGWVTATYDNSAGSSTVYVQYYTNALPLSINTDYNVVLEVKSKSGSGFVTPVTGHSTGQFTTDWTNSFADLANNTTYTHISKTKSDFTGVVHSLRTLLIFNAGQSGTVTFRLSLLADTSITPQTFVYQPYTGGTASPNPDYPQDIQAVAGEQNVWVHGKNLFDPSLYNGLTPGDNGGWKTTKYYTDTVGVTYQLKPNTRYAISMVNLDGTRLYGSDGRFSFSVNGTWLNNNNGIATFLTNATGQATIKAGASYWDGIGTTEYNIQLEEGNAFTSWEPYQGATYTIDLGATELCKIGNYQDYIYKSGDDWYVHKAIGKVILDGSENYAREFRNKTNTYAVAITNGVADTKWTSAWYVNDLKSDKFISYSFNYLYNASNDIEGICLDTANAFPKPPFVIALLKSRLSEVSINGVKAWLSTHNITVYYALATTTDTQITDSTLIGQLNALYNAKMLAGQTNFAVSAVSPNLPAILDITVFNANAQGLIATIRGN